MKVLFDEDVPAKLARSLSRHEIHTVVTMQWGGIKNRELLKLIEREGFDVFLISVSAERRRAIIEELRKHFAAVDAQRLPVSSQEADEIINEALRSTRPNYRPMH